jgi:hypothetical protein
MDGPARAPIPNLNVVVVAVTTKDCCRCGNDYKRTREGPVPLATAAAAVTAATWCGSLSTIMGVLPVGDGGTNRQPLPAWPAA